MRVCMSVSLPWGKNWQDQEIEHYGRRLNSCILNRKMTLCVIFYNMSACLRKQCSFQYYKFKAESTVDCYYRYRMRIYIKELFLMLYIFSVFFITNIFPSTILYRINGLKGKKCKHITFKHILYWDYYFTIYLNKFFLLLLEFYHRLFPRSFHCLR